MAKALAALSLRGVIVAQSGQPTFRARVDLVQIDVVNADGKTVRAAPILRAILADGPANATRETGFVIR